MTARGNSRLTEWKGKKIALVAVAGLCAFLFAGGSPRAQEAIQSFGDAVNVPSDAKLFLEADTVIYSSNSAVVTAGGGVQIDYGGYKLVARQVVYNQKTRRLIAAGDVELQQPDGNRIYADSADITDDFADGFVNALRVETPDNTRFAAKGAVRERGSVTTFEQGVYTACEACKEHPERAPLWQVKARKIVWDQQEKVVRYYGAKFELFGAPIAYLPYFQSPDPTVKRKSGFLTPSFVSSSDLGYGLRVPYFFALSDSYDATVAGTYYSRQGFLGEAEFRQATGNGFYTLQAAGISQRDPDAFADDGLTFDVSSGAYRSRSPDFLNEERGMIGTIGRFDLSDRWTFGWDILAQSDQNFSNTYNIQNFGRTFHTSEIYLSGLGDRSFFDLRAERFDIQSLSDLDQDLQPDILPTLDYQTIDPSPIGGGEVQVDVNVVNLRRGDSDAGSLLICEQGFVINGGCDGRADDTTVGGLLNSNRVFPFRDDVFDRSVLEGDYSRGTASAEWRRTITTDGGLLLTPSLGVRGDVYQADMSIDGFGFPADPFVGRTAGVDLGGIDIDTSGFRGMATAGLEARYPVIIEAANSSHIIEPIAQLLVRPNETDVGQLPNEDAQSLVFSTANLFDKDKFSGFDRIEGGTRANVGLRYAGTFATGYAVDAMVGQSYRIAGDNPFDQVDLALVGFDSGLETDRSDYVGSLALATPVGFDFGALARFDEETLENRRTDLLTSYANQRGSIGVVYSFIGEQPTYGFPEDRSQVTANASLKLTQEWTAYGSLGYDLKNSTLISRSLGLGYLDECFSLTATYQSTEDNYQINDAQNQVMVRIGLRTIADTDFNYKLGDRN